MENPTNPLLSELTEPQTRRVFLTRASALSLVIPGMGAALSACSPEHGAATDTTRRAAGTPPTQQPGGNSDSRLDSTVLKPGQHPGAAATGGAGGGVASTPFHVFDASLPPAPANGHLQLHWRTREVPVRITDDTVVAAWTFEGDIPGPIVHCRVGDTVEFTLTNEAEIPHSMDFHAAQIDPKQAFRSVPKGQSVTFTFQPKYAGAFLYHCGTAPVLMHIGSGMFGAIIVSPRTPLPPAREYVLIQNEMYLADAVNGVRGSDYQKMLNTLPDYFAFNGRPNQYIAHPLRAKVGERVRFYVVTAGPTHPNHFHVVGEQFDTVYLGAPPSSAIHGVQTHTVPPGGGTVFELVFDKPGEYPFVNHGFGHGQKGSIGMMVVE